MKIFLRINITIYRKFSKEFPCNCSFLGVALAHAMKIEYNYIRLLASLFYFVV